MLNAALAVFALLTKSVILYSAPLEPLVTLPATYFVQILEEPDENGLYKVKYDDLTGYVYASDVERVDYTPRYKYDTSATFTVNNDGQSANLRSSPEKSDNVITVLPSGASGRYYGSILGSALIPAVGGVWYYVSIQDYHGYIYSAQADVTVIPNNVIEAEPTVTPPEEEKPEEKTEPLSDTVTVILISVMCIPAAALMIYMFRKKPNVNKD